MEKPWGPGNKCAEWGRRIASHLVPHLANRSERRKCCWMLSTREPRISSTTLKTRLKLSNCRAIRGGGWIGQRLLTQETVGPSLSLTYPSNQSTDTTYSICYSFNKLLLLLVINSMNEYLPVSAILPQINIYSLLPLNSSPF